MAEKQTTTPPKAGPPSVDVTKTEEVKVEVKSNPFGKKKNRQKKSFPSTKDAAQKPQKQEKLDHSFVRPELQTLEEMFPGKTESDKYTTIKGYINWFFYCLMLGKLYDFICNDRKDGMLAMSLPEWRHYWMLALGSRIQRVDSKKSESSYFTSEYQFHFPQDRPVPLEIFNSLASLGQVEEPNTLTRWIPIFMRPDGAYDKIPSIKTFPVGDKNMNLQYDWDKSWADALRGRFIRKNLTREPIAFNQYLSGNRFPLDHDPQTTVSIQVNYNKELVSLHMTYLQVLEFLSLGFKIADSEIKKLNDFVDKVDKAKKATAPKGKTGKEEIVLVVKEEEKKALSFDDLDSYSADDSLLNSTVKGTFINDQVRELAVTAKGSKYHWDAELFESYILFFETVGTYHNCAQEMPASEKGDESWICQTVISGDEFKVKGLTVHCPRVLSALALVNQFGVFHTDDQKRFGVELDSYVSRDRLIHLWMVKNRTTRMNELLDNNNRKKT